MCVIRAHQARRSQHAAHTTPLDPLAAMPRRLASETQARVDTSIAPADADNAAVVAQQR
jgi:hypothetical protein